MNSPEEAREVGKHIAHKLYGGLAEGGMVKIVDFSRFEETPTVDEYDDTYVVSYRRPKVRHVVPDHVPLPEGEPRERWEYPLGGGGPYIEIEKSTGKIIDFGLSK